MACLTTLLIHRRTEKHFGGRTARCPRSRTRPRPSQKFAQFWLKPRASGSSVRQRVGIPDQELANLSSTAAPPQWCGAAGDTASFRVNEECGIRGPQRVACDAAVRSKPVFRAGYSRRPVRIPRCLRLLPRRRRRLSRDYLVGTESPGMKLLSTPIRQGIQWPWVLRDFP